MNNLQFDDKDEKIGYNYTPNSQKGMVGWLMKKGIAKTQKSAEIILIIATIIIFALSIMVFARRSPAGNTFNDDFQDTEFFDE